jgi:hypothetical protein
VLKKFESDTREVLVAGPVGLALAVSLADLVTKGGGLMGSQAEVISAIQDAFLAAARFAAVALVTSLLIPGKASGRGPTVPPPNFPAEA